MDKKIYYLPETDLQTWNNYVSNLKDNPNLITYTDIYSKKEISKKLDLHGHTIHNAWIIFKEFVEQHIVNGTKEITVITGRSGRISLEFTEWCRKMPQIHSYNPIHTRNGKPGSFRLQLKRSN